MTANPVMGGIPWWRQARDGAHPVPTLASERRSTRERAQGRQLSHRVR